MSWDDVYVEIYDEMNNLNIKKEFDEQLKKMHLQEKHKYTETRERWKYAADKVKRLYA